MSTKAICPFNVVDYNKATIEFGNKIPVLLDNYYMKNTLKSPCIFIYKREHNDNVYKVANELLTDAYYNMILPPNNYGGKNVCYLPTQNSIMVQKTLEVDENFKANTYLVTFAKLGYKKIAEQVNLMDTVTSNIISDSKAKNQLGFSFSRENGVDYLYIFIIDELRKIYDDEANLEKLKYDAEVYTKNYYIRIK